MRAVFRYTACLFLGGLFREIFSVLLFLSSFIVNVFLKVGTLI